LNQAAGPEKTPASPKGGHGSGEIMGVPFRQQLRVAGYITKQKLRGRKRYPLVLMLEPLFRCNLACSGCGKIDYPAPILNRRLSPQECWQAAEECGAPMVAIPGGEPLIHKEIGEIVNGLVERKFYVSLCTNALLLEKKLDLFEPSPYLFFSVHLDGLKEHHDRSVCQKGVFEKAIDAIKAAQARGFMVNVNATIFDGYPADELADFLDFATDLGVGISLSPGFAYERAPNQEHFLDALHPLGHANPERLWLAEALLPAGRGLCAQLRRTDGIHRVGEIRHRRV
jgi:hopanoid biosynthesis associated radical SAM protein HpnH